MIGIDCFNTLRPRQNGRRFPDDIFKCIFLNENVWYSIEISLKFVPKGPINNSPALVQIMAWRRSGDKPLSEPMMISLMTHMCITRLIVNNYHRFLDGRESVFLWNDSLWNLWNNWPRFKLQYSPYSMWEDMCCCIVVIFPVINKTHVMYLWELLFMILCYTTLEPIATDEVIC